MPDYIVVVPNTNKTEACVIFRREGQGSKHSRNPQNEMVYLLNVYVIFQEAAEVNSHSSELFHDCYGMKNV